MSNQPHHPRQIFRTIAVGLIISADGKVLIGKKKDGGVYPDCWHLPGGGVKKDETLKQALVREIKEETGMDLNKIKATINLIDDRGRGEHYRTTANKEKVLAKMQFMVFEVRLNLSSADINLKPGDDLGELHWITLDQLDKYQHTPPSVELFKRLELI